ncbi:Lipin-3 [Tyrophagus putrescentiae]|nr:Lipin-3 [Tyrophagus putrescentiae]
MNYIGKIISNIGLAYSEINPATLTGAIDVIIVEQADGSFKCSPFHVRFGKMGVIRSKEKIVDIEINGIPVDIHMKLGDSGEAYFLEEYDEVEAGEEVLTAAITTTSSTSPTATTEVQSPPPPSDTLNDNDETTAENTTNHQYTDGELHPFSDSEVGHIVHHIYKKQESIDPYDCKSDSEYEIFKANTQTSAEKAGVAEHDNISWDWGELPNVSSGCAAAAAAAAAVAAHQKDSLANGNGAKMEVVVGGSTHTQHAENKRSTSPRSSMLGGMLGFIKGGETAAAAPMSPGTGSNSTAVPSNGHHAHYPQHQNHPNNDEDKGIYLDDLDPNDMNPEVAAKYFPNRAPGPRCPTRRTPPIPSTSDFASEYSQLLNSNDLSLLSTFDLSTLSKVYHDMSMSLCGGIENLVENPGDTEHFLQSIISFDDFSENPLAILNDPNLVVRMGGRYFTWKMASAIILSLLMFQRPLPETTMDSLREQCIPKKKKKPPPVSAQNSSASSWRNWSIFRSNTSESSSANVQTIDETSSTGGGGGGQHSAENSTETRSLNSSNSSEGVAVLQSKQQHQLGTPSHKMSNNLNNSLEYTSDEETMNIVLSSSSHKTSGPGTAVTSTPGTATSTSTTNSSTESSTATSTPGHTKSKVRYRKVLRLKSDIVRSLNLKRNCNDVMFSVTTAFQGTTVCRSKIFLWRWDDKVVISDIDGTITKSDVLGHILPYIGKDWAQLGVTQLYSNIEANSYRFLYLSARAIGQAKTTREYLRDLRQDDIGLPDGPLLLSPTSLFSALHREVIEKKPEEFKIACLKDIQSLFPENPFFAGFGNKINDNWAYKAVGIDSSRIFTINHKGELRLDRLLSFKSSCSPPLQQSAYYDGYSSFMFWRPDIPELDDAELKDAKD